MDIHIHFLEFIGFENGTFAIRGLAIYGGVIGGFVGVLIFCAIKKSFSYFAGIDGYFSSSSYIRTSNGSLGQLFLTKRLTDML